MYNMNLNSNRLIFKHYTKIDFNDFKAILMDDEIMKHISGKGNSEKVTKRDKASCWFCKISRYG